MTKPLLAILSSQPRLLSELPQRLLDEFELLLCDSIDEAEDLCINHHPQFLVADFERASADGLSEERFLQHLRTELNDLQTLVLTGENTPANLTAPRSNAASGTVLDCQVLPTSSTDEIVDRLLGILAAERGTSDRKPEPAEAAETVLTGISRNYETNSPEMQRMLRDLEIAAKHDVTILLIGETGAGKTFLSRLIHEVSPRRDEPFLHVACGALPNELIESELFGHMKGSFTSAHADKEGKFTAAGRGTVLLDEIDVLGPEQQVKLLKVIETGEYEPVGCNITRRSEARLVVASNLQLQPLVDSGRFRPDLYFRLNMLKFEILPLRERTCDVVPLAHKFVRQQSLKHSISISRIDRSFTEALQLYSWPGNVRELENVIQRSVIYCSDGVLTSQQLPDHVVNHLRPKTTPQAVRNPGAEESETDQTLDSRIAVTEKEIIEQALFNNNFSRTKTAAELGISRVTLYNKMKKYGI